MFTSLYRCDFHPFLSVVTLDSFIFSELSFNNQVMLNYVTSIQELVSYIQATYHPYWQKAMNKELSALSLNNTWDVVVLPIRKKALLSKLVYKVKQYSDESIERLKTKLIIRDDVQREGVDYNENFLTNILKNDH